MGTVFLYFSHMKKAHSAHSHLHRFRDSCESLLAGWAQFLAESMSPSPLVFKEAGLHSDPNHCGPYFVHGLDATQKATVLYLLFKYITK